MQGSFNPNQMERLIPVHIDWNRKENMEAHSTIYYDIPAIVLRRGQQFSFRFIFNQAFHSDKYRLLFLFKPQTWRNFPVVKVPLDESSNGWSAKIISSENEQQNSLNVQFISSSDALIGRYSILLEVLPNNHLEERAVFQFDTDLCLLFNPWEKTDVCGLLSSDQLAEYVLNEHGDIYLGSADLPRTIPWYFGQFEGVVLLAALTLLNRTQIPAQQRMDPSIVLRILTSNISSNPGAISGVFPSSFDVQPLLCQQNAYTSSPAILKQYLTFDDQAVQGDSGSTWQHAAVLCSLCRALGIPSRLVTIYNATTREPTLMMRGNSSITSPYYLWNECWMRRDDLPKDKSGWQVVDSSSIQSNMKLRRLGPCPVAALKAGTLDLKWDTPAIYALLNGNQRLLGKTQDTSNVKILTKSLKNDHTSEDLTGNYISNRASNATSSNQDVNIETNIPDSLKPGEDLIITLNLNNPSQEQRTLAVVVTLVKIDRIDQPASTVEGFHQASFYDPNTLYRNSSIPIQPSVQHLRPNELKSIRLKVAEKHQLSQQCFDSLLRLNVRAMVKETGQVYRKEKYILNEDNITIKLDFDDDVVEIGQAAKLNIQVHNSPLYSWNNGRVIVDGFGMLERFSIRKQQPSNNSITIPIQFVPLRLGIGRIYVNIFTDSSCLPPQSILLEVTGPSEKNSDTSNHVALQQSSTEEEMKLRPTPHDLAVDSTQEKRLLTNLSNTTATFIAPTEANDNIRIPLLNVSNLEQTTIPTEEDEKQPSGTIAYQSTIEKIEKPTATEDIDEQQNTLTIPGMLDQSDVRITFSPATPQPPDSDEEEMTPAYFFFAQLKDRIPESNTEITTTVEEDVTPLSAAPFELKNENVGRFTRTQETNKPQDVVATSMSTSESKTENEGATSILTPLTQTLANQTKREDEDRRQEKMPSWDSGSPKVTDWNYIRQKKEDDHIELSQTPSLNKTEETVITTNTVKKGREAEDAKSTPILPEEHITETVTKTTTVEEKQTDEQTESPKLFSSDKATETTLSQNDREDDKEIVLKSPSLNSTIEKSAETTTTTTIEDDQAVPTQNFYWADNIIPTADEATQSNLPETSLLTSSTDTVTQSSKAADENKQDEILSTVQSSNTAIEKVSKDTTTQAERISSQTPSFATKTQTVTQTMVVDDEEHQLARTLSLDSIEGEAEEKKKDEKTELEEVAPLDDATKVVTETTTIQNKNEDEELSKTLSSEPAIARITEITTVTTNSEDEQVPSLNTASWNRLLPTADEGLLSQRFEEKASSDIPASKTTTETVTQSDTDEHKIDDDQTRPWKALSEDNIIETTSETTTKIEENKTSMILPLDNTVKPVIETSIIELVEDDSQSTSSSTSSSRSSSTSSLDSMTEVITETNTAEEDKQNEDIEVSEISSLGNDRETVIENWNDKQATESSKLEKIPSSEDVIQLKTTTTSIEDEIDDEERKLPKISSSDVTIEIIPEKTGLEGRTDSVEQVSRETPALHETTITETTSSDQQPQAVPVSDNTSESITEITTITKTTNEEVEQEVPSNTPVSDDLVSNINETPVLERVQSANQTGQHEIPVIDEDKKEDEQSRLLEIPPAYRIIQTITETTTVEENKDDDTSKLPKVPSLDSLDEKTVESASEQDDKQNKPLESPSADTTVVTVSETTTVEDTNEDDQSRLLKTSSLDNTIETVTETTTVEEKVEDGQMISTEAPAFEHPTETITQTTTLHDKPEDYERNVPKIQAIVGKRRKRSKVSFFDDMAEALTEPLPTEDKMEVEEVEVLQTLPVDIITETVPETRFGKKTRADEERNEAVLLDAPSFTTIGTINQPTVNEEKEESEDLKLSKAFSLDSIDGKFDDKAENEEVELLMTTPREITTETVIDTRINDDFSLKNSMELDTDTFTNDEQKGVEETQWSDRSSLDTTEGTVTTTTTVEEKKENKLSDIPTVDNVMERENETFFTHIPMPENLVLDSSFGSTSQPIEKQVVVVEEIDVEKPKKIKAKPFIEDYHQIRQGTESIDEETKYITRSSGRSTERNIPMPENIVLDSSFATSAIEMNGAISSGEDKSTTSLEHITSSSILPDVTENDRRQTVQDNDAPIEVTRTEIMTEYDDQSTSNEDMRSWLNDLLRRITSSDETEKAEDLAVHATQMNNETERRATVEEPIVSVPGATEMYLKKTTITTETTTTTIDEDSSIPAEDSTKTLKYLVNQNTLSDDESTSYGTPIEWISTENISTMESDSPAIATTIPKEPSDDDFTDDSTPERRETRTNTMSTSQDIDSLSHVDDELPNESSDSFAVYATSLTNDILESAIYSYILESNLKANPSTDEPIPDHSNQL